MDQVISLLQGRHGAAVKFIKAEAENAYEAAEAFGVSMVPSFVVLSHAKKVDMVEGANPQKLQVAIEKNLSAAASKPASGAAAEATGSLAAAASAPTAPSAGSSEELDARLRRLTQSGAVVLFMKGSPEAPRCKFSRAMVELLNEKEVRFVSFDILQDPAVREGLKTFANHQTYPQLWVVGKLVGGTDVVKEIAAKDDGKGLQALLVEAANAGAPKRKAAPAGPVVDDEYLRKLVSSAPVLLFMKGSPDTPRCGFSAKMVGLLQDKGIKFSTFDILENEEVRQNLKTFAKWKTYPQLWVNGSLVGGLDIVQEMAEMSDDLADELGIEALDKRLAKLVKQSPNMLFMKGVPDEPRCGFSRQIVEILRAEGISFGSFDILQDEEVRQGLKDFANWRTFPMLFSDGKLVGGLDVVQELQEEGELKETVSQAQ
ncbi:Monothiol glutaredoxin-S11 [Hondaea fermentalgiana]|uniref:Monothiol glutaredoxin-S11 n=1 Tax=Hondaea fermentalgiana TaxID=2315210 RepID=A0A2R5GEU8_9STRA|nr:Monothiol glutaredoxin-S11 [Hondaea fermentalgiana]|eukprot:GBG27123.1 Monothiol glutaredoxin-S11 [Hondaea fermentalgiana]